MIHPIRITKNEQGSLIATTEDGWYVHKITQRVNNHLRGHWLQGTLEQIINLNLQEGTVIPGMIEVERSTEPFNPGDPEEYLLWSGGEVVRENGKAVYERAWYNPNAMLQAESL